MQYAPQVDPTVRTSRTSRRGRWTHAVAVVPLLGGLAHAQTVLLPSGSSGGDRFAESVALDGNAALIGSPGYSVASGAAYVFREFGGTWTEEALLRALDNASNDEFGNSVAIDGDTAAVGAWRRSDSFLQQGAVYVFTRTAGSWAQTAKVSSPQQQYGQHFGKSVALDGDRLLVGAPDGGFPGVAGTAYVFDRAGSTWVHAGTLTSSDPKRFQQFGFTVALDGDRAAIGAIGDDNGGGFGEGAVYVHEFSGGLWPQVAKLVAPDASVGALLGHGVALQGDTVVIGALGHWLGGVHDVGAAYFAERVAGTWFVGPPVFASDWSSQGQFGASVAIDGGAAVVGGPKVLGLGAAYLFYRIGPAGSTAWSEVAALRSTTYQDQGWAVDVSSEHVVAGAPYFQPPSGNSGAAFVYPTIEAPTVYCTAKTNSLGCVPSIGSSGLPRVTGVDAFTIHASNVLSSKWGILFWGSTAISLPFQGGVLCVKPPLVRTDPQPSGGNPPPVDCSGSYSFHFSQAYMASNLVWAGSTLRAQFWSRDPGFALPNNVGLTDALSFVVGP